MEVQSGKTNGTNAAAAATSAAVITTKATNAAAAAEVAEDAQQQYLPRRNGNTLEYRGTGSNGSNVLIVVTI